MPRVTRSPRNSVKDRPAWIKLLLRRQKRLLRPAAWVAGTFLLTMLLIGLLRSAAPAGSLVTLQERIGGLTAFAGLRVQHIEFEGRQNTPEPLLRAALGVTRGEPILGFSLDAARKRIETLSWIKQATVERQLPDTIVVNVEERRPFAVWQNNSKFVLIDRAGNVVAHQDVANFRNLPLVVGPGAPEAAAPLIDALTARPALQKFVIAAGTRGRAALEPADEQWRQRDAAGGPRGSRARSTDAVAAGPRFAGSPVGCDRPAPAGPAGAAPKARRRRCTAATSEETDMTGERAMAGWSCRRTRGLPLPLREGDRGRGADPEGPQLCAPLPPTLVRFAIQAHKGRGNLSSLLSIVP